MSYVNLYAVKFDSLRDPKFTVELIKDYKKKEAAARELQPKPLKLSKGYVIYIWSHDEETAKVKAERIIKDV